MNTEEDFIESRDDPEGKPCPNCDKNVLPESFPFGEDVQCWNCRKIFHTEMEESYDSLYWWFLGEVK